MKKAIPRGPVPPWLAPLLALAACSGFWAHGPAPGVSRRPGSGRGRVGSGGRGREPATLFLPYLPLTTSCPEGTHVDLGTLDRGPDGQREPAAVPEASPPPPRGAGRGTAGAAPRRLLSCPMSLLNLIKCSRGSGVQDGWGRPGPKGWGFTTHAPHTPPFLKGGV